MAMCEKKREFEIESTVILNFDRNLDQNCIRRIGMESKIIFRESEFGIRNIFKMIEELTRQFNGNISQNN